VSPQNSVALVISPKYTISGNLFLLFIELYDAYNNKIKFVTN